MKICFNCHAELEDNDMFCSSCGKKYKSKNGVIICPMCKNTLIQNELLCDTCYNELQVSVNSLKEEIDRSDALIRGDYGTLVNYVGLLARLTKLYKEMYGYAKYLPKQIDIDPKTFEEYQEITYLSLEDTINHRIDTYYYQLRRFGDAEMLAELDIMKQEMLRASTRYPEFKQYLSTDRIDNILTAYDK